MKTTRYFDEQVRRKRPYIELAWCVQVVAAPIHMGKQGDGRVRFGERSLRMAKPTHAIYASITLEDSETIHNAFFDRRFGKEEQA